MHVALYLYAEKKSMYYICHSKPSAIFGRNPNCKQNTGVYSYHLKALLNKLRAQELGGLLV